MLMGCFVLWSLAIYHPPYSVVCRGLAASAAAGGKVCITSRKDAKIIYIFTTSLPCVSSLRLYALALDKKKGVPSIDGTPFAIRSSLACHQAGLLALGSAGGSQPSHRGEPRQWPALAFALPVPDYSGGTAPDSHRVPVCLAGF
jgi:hypothetical protein